VVIALSVTFWLVTGAVPSSAEAMRAARALVDEAMDVARAQDKTVLVVFGASWCGPCRRLDQFLGAPEIAPIIGAHFVLVHLDVDEKDASLENPGADELKAQLGGGSPIPYYCFLDREGKRLADSRNPDDIGFPSTLGEIGAFDALLQRVEPRMTESERGRIKRKLLVMAVHQNWSELLALRKSPTWRALGAAGSSLALAAGLLGWLVLKRRRTRPVTRLSQRR
jgi:thiol-disulfide isomerase/thioredoxin